MTTDTDAPSAADAETRRRAGGTAALEASAGSARRAGRRREGRPGLDVDRLGITLLFFAPVAWMVLTSLHIEADAATNPPSVFAPLTFENYGALFDRDVLPFLINSLMASVLSTLLVLVLAVPAAYALSIRPVEKWTDVMFFFLSTKFLPPIAALLPIYLIVRTPGCSTTSSPWSSSTPR